MEKSEIWIEIASNLKLEPRFDETHFRVINRTLVEVIARIYVINCPSWAVWFYKRIEWWVPAKTRKKIKFLSSNFRGEFERVFGVGLTQSLVEAAAQLEKQLSTPSTAVTGDDRSAESDLPLTKGDELIKHPN